MLSGKSDIGIGLAFSFAIQEQLSPPLLAISDAGLKMMETLISEFRRLLPLTDLRRETRRGTTVYNGNFNLVLKGARDWITSHSS